MSLRQIAAARPAMAAILCAAAQFLLTVLILKLGIAYAPPEAFGKVKLVAFASTVILPLLLTQAFGMWKEVGFEMQKVRPAPIFMVSLLTGALFLSMGVHAQGNGSFAGALAMQFINAFGEELLFRGVIFALLLRLSKGRAIVLNGILFGSMHLIHGFMDGNWTTALSQAAVTSVAGMMFTAVRYGTGSLWLVIFLHMILNLCMIYSNIEPAAGPAALFVVQRLANVFEIALAGYVIFHGTRSQGLGQDGGGAILR
ncbi:MAG TPA: CPBP family intramembrane glutamic endopeptidase [Telluria sp.]|nr:CPBP family intramembrane glutamic endopeptidase [Telluria sp.]